MTRRKTLAQIAFISFALCNGLTYAKEKSENDIFEKQTQTLNETTSTSNQPTVLSEAVTIMTTTELMVTANTSRCPLVIVTPGFISEYFGSFVSFTGYVESYSDRALLSRWLKIKSDITEVVDINRIKYLGSKRYPYPKLTINDLNFQDDVDYQLQVQITGGWCHSNIVNLEVRGILTFYDPCNMTKECNRNKALYCSSKYNSCMCRSAFYHRNRTCFIRNNLRAVYKRSEITTTLITSWWDHPAVDSSLIQSYTTVLTESGLTLNLSETVGNNTNCTFASNFLPGYLYYFRIISEVLLSDPTETIFVTYLIPLVVDPLPPGPILRNESNLHPDHLFLKWLPPVHGIHVNRFRISVNGRTDDSSPNEISWKTKLEPGTKYNVSLVSISWYPRNFQKASAQYIEQIETLRTPKIDLKPLRLNIPYLSSVTLNASIRNLSGFPPTTEVKWRRNRIDINITDSKYKGSTLNLYSPILFINRVDFYNEHNFYFDCIARNSEGWGTSEDAVITLYGSLKFLEPCNESRECEPNKNYVCHSYTCLCSDSYYHENSICYHRNRLKVSIQKVMKTTCKTSVRWNKPLHDSHLISGYVIDFQAHRSNRWLTEEIISMGNVTEYSTPCKLQPGRLYRFIIQSKVSLRNPSENISVDIHSANIILEPLSPRKLDRVKSNFSSQQLYLKWEEPAGNTFLNHYLVTINGHQQQTLGNYPEVYWRKGLVPGAMYNVSITAVSHGDIMGGPWLGTAKSKPYVDWMEVDQIKGGYIHMPYGERDNVFRGDDKTSPYLRSPMTIYALDGSERGFNYVIIGSNGVIGLGEEFNWFSTHNLHSSKMKERQIICPFWTDLLTTDTASGIYYNTYQRGQDAENTLFLNKANEMIRIQFPDFSDFEATWLVKVTWENMTLFGYKSQIVTFQCLLITDGVNTFTVINYIDVNLKPIKNKKIVVGYRFQKIFTKNVLSNKHAAFQMSKNPGNRGVPGFWIYKMSTGIPLKKDDKVCYDWYIKNKELEVRDQLLPALSQIRCPCDSRLLRFDPRYNINRFDRKYRVLCYASMTVGRNAECCYRLHRRIDNLSVLERTVPAVGSLLQYNPFFERHLYIKNDLKPREACSKSGHFKWYYEVRPIPSCYRRSPFRPGINSGDPHIRTLDGKSYTFNGHGEYVMMAIAKDGTKFDFQARTEPATTSNVTAINATIFSAFVAQDQTGSKVQIEISPDKNDLIIRGNGNDLTTRFQNTNYTYLTQNLSIQWENKSISASFFQSSIVLKVSLGVRFLISEVVVDDTYMGFVKGLMGNFDGNAANDFILPNGTTLNENATQTERDVFYNFGQQWSVKDKSIFNYNEGLGHENFSHPEFEPLFMDEVDEEQIDSAKEICGPNPSQACIFDFLATGDISIAMSSAMEEAKSINDIAIIENETPRISGNTTINAEIDNEVTLRFNASDDNKERPVFKILKQPEGFRFNATTGEATWTPLNTNISEISVSVVDEMGVESPSLDVTIIMCSGCSNNGHCDYENVEATEHALNYKAGCICNIGFTGENCEQDIDACVQSPCSLDRNCTDLTPTEEVILGRGYNCSECPPGFMDVGTKCADVDECSAEYTTTCNASTEICENTEGSYICHCVSGYRKVNNICRDIDECFEGTSDCVQICRNTPGSFYCDCHLGFTLHTDRTSCVKSEHNLCENFENCEYSCGNTTGTLKCVCPLGYELASNDINCKDINECELATTVCEQDCINTKGAFNCTCRPGYFLNGDQTSCSECEIPNYGENCSKLCECGSGGDRCDPVSGCVCLSGWTGVKCDEDIDECSVDPFICGSDRVCQNLEGSYSCICRDGFDIKGSKCEDIDECADESLNDCPELTTFCRNTNGNYTCECQSGFQLINDECEDINECETGRHGCSQMCINVDGDYNCACHSGFNLQNDRKMCEKVKDTCSLFPGLNCSYGCIQSAQDPGEIICLCENGFQLASDMKTCIDIDECQKNTTCDHNCTNTAGSFECECAIGYELQNDGISCKACNGYFYGMDCNTPCKCGRGATACHHVTGCVCHLGWTGETCEIDIDECERSPCIGEHELCLNTPGSYRCDCVTGFNNSEGSCTDIDECQNPTSCHQICINTEGSYQCDCDTGFKLTNENYCIDINECIDTRCHDCNNWPGGFECFCDQGYKVNTATHTDCQNINECDDGSNQCSSDAICTDTIGSYLCKCPRGFKGNGFMCQACENFTFGEQCSQVCTCVTNQTEYCNASSGFCQCISGWEGSDCSKDVDECQKNITQCDKKLQQACINTPGSAHCECRFGGSRLDNCVYPESSYSTNETEMKVRVEVEFATNTSRQEFLLKSQELRKEFQISLESYYKKENVSGFLLLKVLSIRFGSLIVDYEIIGNKSESDSFESDLASTMTKLLNGDRTLVVLNQTPAIMQIMIKDQNGTSMKYISSVAKPCFVFESFGGTCVLGEKCDDSSGEATCVKNSSNENLPILLIVIGASCGSLCMIILAACVCWRYQKKYADQTKVFDISETNVKVKEPSNLTSEKKYKPVERNVVKSAWKLIDLESI